MENFFYGEDTAVVSESAKIDFSNITRIEYRGHLTLTTEQLAEFYGTKVKNIQTNFQNNAERFIEGDHYFKLEGEELQLLKNYSNEIGSVFKHSRILYLWTKRGAARHAKMISTDKAWEVFELLENAYFDAQKVIPNTPITNISDFQRGKELVKLAQTVPEPTAKMKLAIKATNLILGEEFFKADDFNFTKQLLLQF